MSTPNKLFGCIICNKSFVWRKSLARHAKTEHKMLIPVDPNDVHLSNVKVKDNTTLLSYSCSKCGQIFSTQQFLDNHVKEKAHMQEYPVDCFVCKKLFSTEDELNVHVSQEHIPSCHAAQQLPGTVSDDIICKQLKFEHPFSMIVAGPSHCGKTH